jgi:glutathione S-transferase
MVEYVSVEEARRRSGLRVVMVGTVPSPWGEAAKGILHVERIPYVAARMGPEAEAVREWTGQDSAPIAVYDDERPRTGWAEILLLAERLAPEPRLIPRDPQERALTRGEGFPKPIAEYLGAKYGYRGDNGEAAGRRVIELLQMFAARLERQRREGSDYLIGSALTAADIYLATFMAVLQPLPPEQCPMPDAFRAAFEVMDDDTRRALHPSLLEHRNRIYHTHLELPLSL